MIEITVNGALRQVESARVRLCGPPPYERGRTPNPLRFVAGSAAVQDSKGVNITEILLNGADARAVNPIVSMPAFARGLTDDELAALANFTIERFGRRPGNVSAKDIENARANEAQRRGACRHPKLGSGTVGFERSQQPHSQALERRRLT
jgi:hypothetical protein